MATFQSSYLKTGVTPALAKTTQRKRLKKKQEKVATDEELDPEEIKKKQQQYLNVLTDLARLRDHYYTVYLSKLEEKVLNQRKAIAAKEEQTKRRLIKQQQKQAAEAHKFVKKLPHHKPSKSDSDFLLKVPKSHYYHLTAVENLMKSRGLLKHKYEVDEFWDRARADKSFWKKSLPSTISPDRLTEHMLSRYSSLTTQSKQENSVTTLPVPVQGGILKKVEEDSEKEETELGDLFDEPPLVFPPQPKFPKLHAFNIKIKMNYGGLEKSVLQDTPSEGSSTISSVVRRRRHQLNQHIKTDAYQLAVVNTAMTDRLLKKHSSVAVPKMHPISGMGEIWCSPSEVNSMSSFQTSKASTGTSGSKSNVGQIVKKRKRKPKNHKATLRSITTVPELDETIEQGKEVGMEPLTMDMMLATQAVSLKEPNLKEQRLWVNYADDHD